MREIFKIKNTNQHCYFKSLKGLFLWYYVIYKKNYTLTKEDWKKNYFTQF